MTPEIEETVELSDDYDPGKLRIIDIEGEPLKLEYEGQELQGDVLELIDGRTVYAVEVGTNDIRFYDKKAEPVYYEGLNYNSITNLVWETKEVSLDGDKIIIKNDGDGNFQLDGGDFNNEFFIKEGGLFIAVESSLENPGAILDYFPRSGVDGALEPVLLKVGEVVKFDEIIDLQEGLSTNEVRVLNGSLQAIDGSGNVHSLNEEQQSALTTKTGVSVATNGTLVMQLTKVTQAEEAATIPSTTEPATSTPVPSDTPQPTTIAPSGTPVPTVQPITVPSDTPTPSATPAPTATETNTETPTVTASLTPTPETETPTVPSPTPTASITPSPEPSPTADYTEQIGIVRDTAEGALEQIREIGEDFATELGAAIPTATATSSTTPVATQTSTTQATNTATNTLTPTASATPVPTTQIPPTSTPVPPTSEPSTPTPTEQNTERPDIFATIQQAATAITATATASPANTNTATAMATNTNTPTETSTSTLTNTSTPTETATSTLMPTVESTDQQTEVPPTVESTLTSTEAATEEPIVTSTPFEEPTNFANEIEAITIVGKSFVDLTPSDIENASSATFVNNEGQTEEVIKVKLGENGSEILIDKSLGSDNKITRDDVVAIKDSEGKVLEPLTPPQFSQIRKSLTVSGSTFGEYFIDSNPTEQSQVYRINDVGDVYSEVNEVGKFENGIFIANEPTPSLEQQSQRELSQQQINLVQTELSEALEDVEERGLQMNLTGADLVTTYVEKMGLNIDIPENSINEQAEWFLKAHPDKSTEMSVNDLKFHNLEVGDVLYFKENYHTERPGEFTHVAVVQNVTSTGIVTVSEYSLGLRNLDSKTIDLQLSMNNIYEPEDGDLTMENGNSVVVVKLNGLIDLEEILDDEDASIPTGNVVVDSNMISNDFTQVFQGMQNQEVIREISTTFDFDNFASNKEDSFLDEKFISQGVLKEKWTDGQKDFYISPEEAKVKTHFFLESLEMLDNLSPGTREWLDEQQGIEIQNIIELRDTLKAIDTKRLYLGNDEDQLNYGEINHMFEQAIMQTNPEIPRPLAIAVSHDIAAMLQNPNAFNNYANAVLNVATSDDIVGKVETSEVTSQMNVEAATRSLHNLRDEYVKGSGYSSMDEYRTEITFKNSMDALDNPRVVKFATIEGLDFILNSPEFENFRNNFDLSNSQGIQTYIFTYLAMTEFGPDAFRGRDAEISEDGLARITDGSGDIDVFTDMKMMILMDHWENAGEKAKSEIQRSGWNYMLDANGNLNEVGLALQLVTFAEYNEPVRNFDGGAWFQSDKISNSIFATINQRFDQETIDDIRDWFDTNLKSHNYNEVKSDLEALKASGYLIGNYGNISGLNKAFVADIYAGNRLVPSQIIYIDKVGEEYCVYYAPGYKETNVNFNSGRETYSERIQRIRNLYSSLKSVA